MARRQTLKDTHTERQLFLNRVWVALFFVVLGVAVLMSRMVYLQVMSHDHYRLLSQENRVRLQVVPPARGLIYDRNGVLLAENQPTYSLEVIPEQVDDLDETIDALRKYVSVSDVDLRRFDRQLKRKRRFQGIPLKTQLSDEEVARFSANRFRFPGIDVKARLSRYYPEKELMAHVIGYVGRIDERDLQRLNPDRYDGTLHTGKIGLEKYYEDRLHGQPGVARVEVNAEGRVLKVLDKQAPIPGDNLTLTIDLELQRIANQLMRENNGAIVAMNPVNGEVLAMVSTPSFDPNLFVNGISHTDFNRLNKSIHRPLYNRVTRGQYPPGSTIKPVVALAGLEAGVIRAKEKMFAKPFYQLPGDDHKYRDWKKTGHGWVDLDKAITQSSDVYFYDLAYKLGIDRFHDFLARFGFGQRVGLDTTGEKSGLLPSREWKKRVKKEGWWHGETLIVGIGQGYMLSTPLQLASMTSTLATRGQRVKPHLLRAASVHQEIGGLVKLEAISPIELNQSEHWDEVLLPMKHVMHAPNGTARRSAYGAKYLIGGKTGTAQVFGVAQDEEYDAETLAKKLHDHALFVGFAPFDDPQIAVAVIVENGGGGSRVAAPIARKIMDAYLLPRLEALQ